jgi:hypothetical protein
LSRIRACGRRGTAKRVTEIRFGETSDARRPDPYSNGVSRNRNSLLPGNQILRPEKEGAKMAMSVERPSAET